MQGVATGCKTAVVVSGLTLAWQTAVATEIFWRGVTEIVTLSLCEKLYTTLRNTPSESDDEV